MQQLRVIFWFHLINESRWPMTKAGLRRESIDFQAARLKYTLFIRQWVIIRRGMPIFIMQREDRNDAESKIIAWPLQAPILTSVITKFWVYGAWRWGECLSAGRDWKFRRSNKHFVLWWAYEVGLGNGWKVKLSPWWSKRGVDESKYSHANLWKNRVRSKHRVQPTKPSVATEPPNINTQVGFSTGLGSFITNNLDQETPTPLPPLYLLFNNSKKEIQARGMTNPLKTLVVIVRLSSRLI